jgi:DNA invertase Pin-like site-specific DNA recombinase
MTKLCGLYARVSTERQSEIKDGSLDTQISRLKSYIAFRNPPDTNAKQDEWNYKGF